jgi:pimeloyl-ACP methyl ester carboxylesterase
MSTFVLVHGGWAGGWYWEKVVPLLEGAGHRVLTPDLPGHGTDPTPVPQISLGSYVQRVVEALDTAAEPVTLVGHSSGGVVVAQATELRPERVRCAVYLCAYLPRDGESVLDLGGTDRQGLVIPNLVLSHDGTAATIREDMVREALFADCSEEDYRRAVARFRSEPLAPATTPVTLTAANFGGVPRVYVACHRDRAISPELQRRMYEATPCADVVSLHTGHSPQYSAPELLAGRLLPLVDVGRPAEVNRALSAPSIPARGTCLKGKEEIGM